MSSIRVRSPAVLARHWGEEQIVVWTDTHAGKLLTRKAGTRGGFQLHVKEESHYLHQGQLFLESVDRGQLQTRTVTAGEAWTVPPGTWHRETALTDCVVFEVSDPTQDDRYGLVPDPGGLPSMTDQEARAKLRSLAASLRLRAEECELLADIIERGGLAAFVPAGLVVP